MSRLAREEREVWQTWPHLCRDGHDEIGWRGDDEWCPVCRERAQARALLRECRPVIERADAVFAPPKGTCVWGATERDALLARLDAALGGQA